MQVATIADIECELGEGLHWDARRQCLWGVDIQGCLVWRWTLDGNVTERWNVGQRVGWVIPVGKSGDELLLGLQGGVALANAASMQITRWLQRPFEGAPIMRLNDAKADSSGAVWCGSLNNDDEIQALGCLYRLGTDGGWQIVDSGYKVANGPAIDAAQKILMHTDSGRRIIYQFDLDVTAGTLSDKRVWMMFAESDGYPDGMCFDAEGALWVAHWGGGCISRFNLEGDLMLKLNLPTTNITNVCFGGQNLDRLFVSSAKIGLSIEQQAKEPLAGRIFEIIGLGVRGLQSLPAGNTLGCPKLPCQLNK